eukprot:bmy_10741T0
MTVEERRKEYLRDYVPLNTIPSWKEEMKGKSQNDVWALGKRALLFHLVLQSVLNQEMLIENCFEKSLF